MMRSCFVGACLLVFGVSAALASDKDWPQWRGPLGTGVAPDAKPPTEWSDTKNIKWKVELSGRGNSTPIIWGDRIYLQTAIKSPDAKAEDKPAEPQGRRRGTPPAPHKYVVMALDRASGKVVWETSVKEEMPHESIHPDSTEASASPVTDGEHIYAFFGSRGLYCLDRDGKVKWEKQLGKMKTRNEFGEGASPALFGDSLVIVWDHEGDDFIVTYDKKTGNERWRKERDEPTGWATPLVVEVGGKPQVITCGTKKCLAYDLASGDVVWSTGGLTANPIPTPVFNDGLAILMSGFRGAAAKAIKLADAKGEVSGPPAIAWTYDKDTPYVPSHCVYGDAVYFLENNKAMLTCLNSKTGEKNFGPQRLEGMGMIYASIAGANNHVYIVGRDGKTYVLKRGKDFEVVATNSLDDGFEASPAIVGNAIYLRGRKYLYCIAAD